MMTDRPGRTRTCSLRFRRPNGNRQLLAISALTLSTFYMNCHSLHEYGSSLVRPENAPTIRSGYVFRAVRFVRVPSTQSPQPQQAHFTSENGVIVRPCPRPISACSIAVLFRPCPRRLTRKKAFPRGAAVWSPPTPVSSSFLTRSRNSSHGLFHL